MRPEDIRRIYAAESAASDDEAAEIRDEAEQDPDTARVYLHTVFSLADSDRVFAQLASIAVGGIVTELIMERAAADDAFALRAARHMTKAMDRMAPTKRTPRGKPGRGTPNKMA